MHGTVYGFGPFRLDPARRALTRGDAPVSLPPKAFDALLFLIEARDRVVAKEELMARLWPDVAVEEASLAQQIFVIRKALEESAEGRTYVATVPRHGYRFVADVAEITPTPAPVGPRIRRANLAVVVAAIAVVVAALGAAALLRMRDGVPAPMVLDVVPPEGFVLSNSIALSPDGRYLALTAADNDGTSNIWVRAIGSDEVRRLPGTDEGLYPFWSPDSASIGFFAAGKLKRIDLAGGPARILSESAPYPRGGAWGEHGTIVFAPAGHAVLHRISADGGPATPVTALSPGEMDHRWPVFLPGGTTVTFMIPGGDLHRTALAVARVDGGVAPHTILNDASSPGFYIDEALLFVRGRTLFAQPFDLRRAQLHGMPSPIRADVWRALGWIGLQGCTAARSSIIACRTGLTETQLVWVDRSGRQTGAIAATNIVNPELSPDGTLLAAGHYDDDAGHDVLAVVDLARSTLRTLINDNIERPVWTPDGRSITFGAQTAGVFDIHEVDLSGEHRRTLLRSSAWKFPFGWSRDGRWLLYQDADGRLLAQAIADEHAAPRVVVAEKTTSGNLSPDGLWVAYSADSSGRLEIYVRPFEGPGGPWVVSKAGGSEPRWSADGRELYYVRQDRRLVAVTVERRGAELWFGGERVLFDQRTYDAGYAYSYAVSPGGDRFLITQFRERGRIAVMLNWRAAASTSSSPASGPPPR